MTKERILKELETLIIEDDGSSNGTSANVMSGGTDKTNLKTADATE